MAFVDDDVEPLFAELSTSLQLALRRNGWTRPVQLEAAVDDYNDALQLSRDLSLGNQPLAALDQWAKELLDWKNKHARVLSSTRRRLAASDLAFKWEVLPVARTGVSSS